MTFQPPMGPPPGMDAMRPAQQAAQQAAQAAQQAAQQVGKTNRRAVHQHQQMVHAQMWAAHPRRREGIGACVRGCVSLLLFALVVVVFGKVLVSWVGGAAHMFH